MAERDSMQSKRESASSAPAARAAAKVTPTPDGPILAAIATVFARTDAEDCAIHTALGDGAPEALQVIGPMPTPFGALYEATETLRLTLSDLSGGLSGDLQAIGSILNDDTAPQLRINDVSVSEGNSTTMTVSLNQVSGAAIQVAWRTTDGTAKDNQDYVRDSGTLTIPAGATSGSVTVRTYEDSTVEPAEVFYVDLSSPVGATIADTRGQVTILDDDGPTLTVSDVTVEEGDTHAVFTVNLSFDPSHNVSFTWSTINGSAVAPGDFTAVSSKAETITTGTSKVITVNLVNDDTDAFSRVPAKFGRAARNGLDNVRVVAPDDVPADLVFATIWSNPPIRIGKRALHDLLASWLGRLTPDGVAVLVVQKHLGADSLQRWLTETGHPTDRIASRAGFRLLRVT